MAAYYGYGQGYDAYAYGAATQDPSAAVAAYGAYAGYVQYPHQVAIFLATLFINHMTCGLNLLLSHSCLLSIDGRSSRHGCFNRYSSTC